MPETAWTTETVLHVRHWSDLLFSLRTSRSTSIRFEAGQFLMLGLQIGERPLLRAYSVASSRYAEHLEFFSIKVPNGPLTSRLQHLRVGDTVLVGRKATGTLLLGDLRPGRNLYLFATGTGLAPFLSVVQDPETYERFEHVVVVHGVRRVADLAYSDFLRRDVYDDESLKDFATGKLRYVPSVTREPFHTNGRNPHLIKTGDVARLAGLPVLDCSTDRAMVCGSLAMLASLREELDARGFAPSPQIGHPADYVFERAFAPT